MRAAVGPWIDDEVVECGVVAAEMGDVLEGGEGDVVGRGDDGVEA